MTDTPPREKKRLLVKLAVLGVIVITVAVLALKGIDIRHQIELGLGLLRQAGPLAFFAAMALAPAAGVPMSLFTFTAAPAFAEELGMGTVIFAAILAVAVNMAVTYWLAAYAMRPLLTKLLARLGYRMPVIETGDMTDMIVIIRVTPALPFFAQNYLLGLAAAPFIKYMVVSCLISGTMNVAFIAFGDALLHGKGKVGLIVFIVIVGLVALTHLLRRHYGKKQAKS